MAKDKITEYDATANNNTLCGDVNIAENSALPSDMNNFAREIMSHLKEGLGSGTPLYVDQTNNRVGINKTPTVALDVSGSLSVDGGTIKLDGNYPTGTGNVALGDLALDDGSLSGGFNTAIGDKSLSSNTSGTNNTALGHQSLFTNSTGGLNSALGLNTLYTNSTGSNNTAVGHSALFANTTASNNTAVGYQALYDNTTAERNTAVGRLAAANTTTGADNTVMGSAALTTNTTGANNIAIGASALRNNTTASGEVAVGYEAGYSQTVAGNNTNVGYRAGYSYASGAGNGFNTMYGYQAGYNNTGFSNTYLGHNSGLDMTSGNKNTIIGRFNGNQGGLDIRTSSNNIVLSDGDGNPRMRVNASGYMSFSPNRNEGTRATNTASTHVVHQTQGDTIAILESTSSSPYGMMIDFSSASPDNNSNYFLACYDSTTTRLFIRSDGDVQNHDNSYGAISDIKLKEQITDASSQWDDIKALQIRKYKMKEDVSIKGDSDEHWRLGVIAQEVETAGMSGLVKNNPDLIKNEDGELVEGDTTTKSVKYSILYMKAVKALQEAMTRIETLEQKVATLEGA